eukprot:2825716-Rhodomonas_salina.1
MVRRLRLLLFYFAVGEPADFAVRGTARRSPGARLARPAVTPSHWQPDSEQPEARRLELRGFKLSKLNLDLDLKLEEVFSSQLES